MNDKIIGKFYNQDPNSEKRHLRESTDNKMDKWTVPAKNQAKYFAEVTKDTYPRPLEIASSSIYIHRQCI